MTVLHRIEDGDIDDLPAVYLRSYLIQYAKAIGTPEKTSEIQALFAKPNATESTISKTQTTTIKQTKPTIDKHTEKTLTHISPSPEGETTSKPQRPITGLIIVVIVIAGAFVWGINTMSATLFVRKKTDNAAESRPAIDITVPTPKKKPLETKKETLLSRKEEIIKRIEDKMPKPASSAPSKKAAASEPSPVVTQVTEGPIADPTATVIAKNNVFVTVKKDGQVIFRSMLLKGARETWSGTDKLEVKISNPADVILEILDSEVPTKNRQKPTNYVVTGNGFYTN
jgi:hypothetical protein